MIVVFGVWAGMAGRTESGGGVLYRAVGVDKEFVLRFLRLIFMIWVTGLLLKEGGGLRGILRFYGGYLVYLETSSLFRITNK